jgi:hypothetical protein
MTESDLLERRLRRTLKAVAERGPVIPDEKLWAQTALHSSTGSRRILFGAVAAVVVAAGFAVVITYGPRSSDIGGSSKGSGKAASSHTAHAGRRSWSSSQLESNRVQAISCPSSSFCVAMGGGPGNDYEQGYAYTYRDGTWSTGLPVDQYTYQDSVSCVSSSFCMMVDSVPGISPAGYQGGYAFTYMNGHWTRGQKIDPYSSLDSVSCTSDSFCMALDYGGYVFTYLEGHWSSGQRIGSATEFGSVSLSSISCTSPSFCVALGGRGPLTFSHGQWGQRTESPYSGSVSCVSMHFCVAVDDDGKVFTYSDGLWSSGKAVGRVTETPSVSCASSSFCTAATGNYEYTYSDGYWSSGQDIDPTGDLAVVSCPSSSFCMAGGNAFIKGNPGAGAFTSRL